jgi:hypothetical protein
MRRSESVTFMLWIYLMLENVGEREVLRQFTTAKATFQQWKFYVIELYCKNKILI